MKNKNLHNLVSCLGPGDDGFGEARLCQKGATPPAGQEAPKPSDGTPVPTEQVKPQTPEEIEAAKREEEKRVAEEADRKKKELKAGVEGQKERAEFRKEEGLPNAGIPPLDSTKPRTMDTAEEAPERGPAGPRTKETEVGKTPRKELEVTLAPMPEKPVWETDQFLKIDLKDERDKLDRWTINVQRENYQINAQTWDHSTPEGLQKIYDDLKILGIIDSSPDFYNTMFPVLRSAADTQNPWLGLDNGKYRPMFKNPTDRTSRDEIERLGKDGVFLGGEAFIKAYDHLQYIRAQVLIAQDKAQLETLSKQRKLDENFVADKTTGFVRDNLAAFQKAIRERDYATAGMYAVGIYAMYKVVGGLFKDGGGGGEHGGGGGGFAKYLLWGSAIYVGHTFLKNAGYDVLKMAGFKDANYDVKDTPMASLNGILGQSEYSEQMKDLDYGMVLRMSDTKLTTLQELFENSNKDGIQFIHPREFPGIFPDLKNVWPFKMGIGEQGLKDYIGMSNTKLGPNEKEYIRVGQQIYKLALAMRVTYDNTLHKDHEKYRGMTYDEALNGKILGQSKVRHLMEAASDYAPGAVAEGLFSAKKRDEIEAKLNQDAFGKMPQEGFHLTEELGPGHFTGYLKDFPIVVVAEPDSFRIYLRNEYGKTYNRNPGRNYITKIPLAGDDKELKAKEAVEGVKKRVEKLLEPFEGVGGRSIVGTTLVYQGGKWQAKVILPGAKKFDIAERETMAIITPDEFGDGVALETEGGVRINVKESLDKQYPIALALIPKLTSQKEFAVLKFFAKAGRLYIKDVDDTGCIIDPKKPADDINNIKPSAFTLKIGKRNLEVRVGYYQGANVADQFRFLSGEADLLKPGTGFSDELSEVLSQDDQLTKIIDSWKLLIANTPESYFTHFFKNVPSWFTEATWYYPLRGISLKDFTGSVPKNYTIGLIEAQKQLITSKLSYSISSAKTLSDVSDQVDKIFSPALLDLQRQRDRFSDLITKNRKAGDNFSEEAFKSDVLFKLSEIGCQSNDYKSWYKQFVNDVFGEYGMDDLQTGNAIKARDLIGVFSYYTAAVDDPSIDGADLNLTIDDETKTKIEQVEKAITDLANATPPITTPDDSQILTQCKKYPGSKIADVAEIQKIKEIGKEYRKAEKYSLHADYVNYVVGEINAKTNEGLLDRDIIPPPGGFWGIQYFDQWKNNQRPSLHEFIDRRKPLTTIKDFVEFDEYLAMTSAQRADQHIQEKVILPRHDCDLLLKANSPERTLFKKLTGNGDFESMKLTGIEKAFYDRMKAALDELERIYAGSLKDGAFADLREQYKLNYTIKNLIPGTLDPSKDASIRYQPVATSMSSHIEEIEKKLKGAKTVTTVYQEELINNTIYRIVQNTILDKNNFDTYFKRTTVPDWINEKWEDFKLWLLG